MTQRDPDTPDIFTGQLPAEMQPPVTALQPAALDALVTTIPQQEIIIDWARYIKLRPWVLQHDPELSYLLGPEMARLIACAATDQQRLLFLTLWVTGGRISEVLAVTPSHFINDPDLGRGVALPTAKKRNKTSHRLIRVYNASYWSTLERSLADHTGGQHAPIFQTKRAKTSKRALPKAISRRTALRWCETALVKLKEHYSPGIEVTPHTFRHSFAVNALLHGKDLKTISGWLGHASVKETERYLKVLSTDTGHLMQGVEYFV